MNTLRLSFSDVTLSRSVVQDEYDLLVGVESTFRLQVGDQVIYTELLFPIVELRAALAAWLQRPEGDFEFISMESDEPGLVWFRRQPSSGWKAGSIHQENIAVGELEWPQVEYGCRQFVYAVDRWVSDNLGIEVDDILGTEGS